MADAPRGASSPNRELDAPEHVLNVLRRDVILEELGELLAETVSDTERASSVKKSGFRAESSPQRRPPELDVPLLVFLL